MAEVKKAVAKASLPSLEAIQNELNNLATKEQRISLLETTAQAYRKHAAAVKSCSLDQTKAIKAAQRLEKRLAYELYSENPARGPQSSSPTTSGEPVTLSGPRSILLR